VSDPVVEHSWKRYTFKFEPAMDHRFITIQAFYKTPVLVPYNGHVLVDHLSSIIRMSCAEENIVEVLEPKEPIATPNKPATTTAQARPNNTTRPDPKTPVKEVHSDAPKILTELERDKLHQGKTIRIENLYFKADSSRMDITSYPVLDEISRFMKQNPDIIIEIGGHTNTKPSHSYCNELSTARAKSVTDYLIEKGVPKAQLQFKGYGKNKPLVTNDTYSRTAQAKNQRVEIKILSLGK
jgi:outer membrane protein OmpA-like peptidoglycan-associated protein